MINVSDHFKNCIPGYIVHSYELKTHPTVLDSSTFGTEA